MTESFVSAELRRLVLERAKNRCEYCGPSQLGQEASFHVDHITPAAAGGRTTSDNLALACVSCSLRKAARTTATDRETGTEVALFNPRLDEWSEHFRWEGVVLAALTAKGRATIHALSMNRALVLSIREEEAVLGRHPTPEGSRG